MTRGRPTRAPTAAICTCVRFPRHTTTTTASNIGRTTSPPSTDKLVTRTVWAAARGVHHWCLSGCESGSGQAQAQRADTGLEGAHARAAHARLRLDSSGIKITIPCHERAPPRPACPWKAGGPCGCVGGRARRAPLVPVGMRIRQRAGPGAAWHRVGGCTRTCCTCAVAAGQFRHQMKPQQETQRRSTQVLVAERALVLQHLLSWHRCTVGPV